MERASFESGWVAIGGALLCVKIAFQKIISGFLPRTPVSYPHSSPPYVD
jgi:hypothetical protein